MDTTTVAPTLRDVKQVRNDLAGKLMLDQSGDVRAAFDWNYVLLQRLIADANGIRLDQVESLDEGTELSEQAAVICRALHLMREEALCPPQRQVLLSPTPFDPFADYRGAEAALLDYLTYTKQEERKESLQHVSSGYLDESQKVRVWEFESGTRRYRITQDAMLTESRIN